MDAIPVCGEEGFDCPFFDPDVCFEGCMLQDEPTDDYAYDEDDQPSFSLRYWG